MQSRLESEVSRLKTEYDMARSESAALQSELRAEVRHFVCLSVGLV